MTLTLDRIALDDVGTEPQRLAEAILGQLDYEVGRVPIDEIARALDIKEIRAEPLNNLEGVLLTTADRDYGAILINSNVSAQRQRFTIGHELGHFLIPSHVCSDVGFHCSRSDMRISTARVDEGRNQQEMEANRFAIEILAPRNEARKFFGADPDMAQILAMAEAFDISRSAAARRFIDLHGDAVAMIFSKKDRLTYSIRSATFPLLSVRLEDLLPLEPYVNRAGANLRVDDADAAFWLTRPPADCELTLQTLFQQDDYAMTLLHLVTPEEEAEPDLEDTFDRFARFNER